MHPMSPAPLSISTQGASVIMLRRDAVLLVERGRGLSKGLWSFPAGRREPGEDAETNARRELYEETRARAGRPVELGLFRAPAAPADFRLTVFAGRAGEGVPVAGDDAVNPEFVPFRLVFERPLTEGAPGWIARALLALSDPQ